MPKTQETYVCPHCSEVLKKLGEDYYIEEDSPDVEDGKKDLRCYHCNAHVKTI